MQNDSKTQWGTVQFISPPEWLVVVAANTGGPQALAELLPQFPENFPGTVVVVQQMRPGFTRVLAEHLSTASALPINEPVDGQALQSSKILITPADTRLIVERAEDFASLGCRVLLQDIADFPDQARSRADATMTSAAAAYGRKTIAVLLTGLGTDGCEGMRAVAEAGGITIAQDESSSVVNDLPASAIAAGVVQESLPIWSIGERIAGIAGEVSHANAA